MNTYYKECFVEQVYHYEALKIWQDLKTGDNLHLIYDDKHGKVVVKKDISCLGVLGEDDSKSILPFLKAGWTDVFTAQLCFKSEKDSEDKRIKIVIYLVSKVKCAFNIRTALQQSDGLSVASNSFYDSIKQDISNNEKVSVYMDGVISLPSVSLNISLGRIIDEEGKDKLKQYVGFVRITKQQAIRLRDYLQRYI